MESPQARGYLLAKVSENSGKGGEGPRNRKIKRGEGPLHLISRCPAGGKYPRINQAHMVPIPYKICIVFAGLSISVSVADTEPHV
jgi:hypothetical protein